MPAGGGPPSLSRDRLNHDKFDDKLLYGAPALAGEGPPTLRRGPHPS